MNDQDQDPQGCFVCFAGLDRAGQGRATQTWGRKEMVVSGGMGRIYDGATETMRSVWMAVVSQFKPIRRGIRRHPSSAADEWSGGTLLKVVSPLRVCSSGLVLAPGEGVHSPSALFRACNPQRTIWSLSVAAL